MSEDTKSVAKEAGEGFDAHAAEGAQDKTDIESILAEYDEEEQKSAPVKPDSGKSAEADVTTALAEFRNFQRSQQQKEDRADLLKAAQEIRGDIGADVWSDDEIIDWLDGQARKHAGLKNGFLKRSENPAAWNKAIGDFGKVFQGKFSKMPDAKVTADRETVSHAVRGASTKAPDPDEKSVAELAMMHPIEKERYIKDLAKRYRGKGA